MSLSSKWTFGDFVVGSIALFFATAISVGLITLCGYISMLLINYLFAPTLLTFIFGISKITFWQAVVLNFLLNSKGQYFSISNIQSAIKKTE